MGLNAGWAELQTRFYRNGSRLVAIVNVLFGYVNKRIIWGRKTSSIVLFKSQLIYNVHNYNPSKN